MVVGARATGWALTQEKSKQERTEASPVDPVAGKSVAEIFGEIVWLMSQDKKARELSIKDLEWLVMPPILLKQFHIKYAPVPDARTVRGEIVRKVGGDSQGRPRLQPIAVELYAMSSVAVAEALQRDPMARLTFQEWCSGQIRTTVASFG
jgi:hemolysin-activating ACP:hemolysin acyltransferase